MVLLDHVPNPLRVVKSAFFLNDTLIFFHGIFRPKRDTHILAQGTDGYFCGQVDKPRRVTFPQLVEVREEEMFNQDTGHHGLSHNVKI